MKCIPESWGSWLMELPSHLSMILGKSQQSRCNYHLWLMTSKIHFPRLSMTLCTTTSARVPQKQKRCWAPPHQPSAREAQSTSKHHQLNHEPKQLHTGTSQTGGTSLLMAISSAWTLSLHSPVTQHRVLPTLSVAISTHMSMHQVPQEHVQEGEGLGTAHLACFNRIRASSTETAQKWDEGRAHHCHWWQQPSPGGKVCIPLPISQWCSRRESPTQDKAEQQQGLLPIQAVGIYTTGTRVNPWSLMRTDPMLPSSPLAQALICILNSCSRRPDVLQRCCCIGCLFDCPFWPECSWDVDATTQHRCAGRTAVN